MPLANYGVLKGTAIGRVLGEGRNPHYQIRVVDDTTHYRVAVNVKSKLAPSELEYLVVEGFEHPIVAGLRDLMLGFHALPSQPGGLALDFIRGNFFDRTAMKKLPFNLPGPDNDLNEKVDRHVSAAIGDEEAIVYAFGQRWGPERNKTDKIFGFLPGNGVHDVHMNQGNVGQFVGDDGVWQDGGLVLHFPALDHWVGIFLKFQSQAWHTDDATGHTIPGGTDLPNPPLPGEPDLIVRIVAALVNPTGPDGRSRESVTLLNTSPRAIDLGGWAIANTHKKKRTLSGTIGPGAIRVVDLPAEVPLGNNGGIITLLDGRGLKVHGVSYTKAQANRDGWTIVF